jgi:ferrochelatase
VVVVPLFPQYAAASFGSAAEAAMLQAGRRWMVPALHVVEPFWNAPEFLDLLADRLRVAMEREQPDHVLFSYHGVPERHCQRTDLTGAHCLKASTCCDAIVQANRHCYRAQCFATTREVVARLGLAPEQYTVAFQSRLGRTPWIRPYTDHLLTELGQRGLKKVLVAEPSFVADCLETLEEIGIRGREDFQAAGGGELTLVPSLNAGEDWGRALAAIVRRSSGWFGQAQASEMAAARSSTASTSASDT